MKLAKPNCPNCGSPAEFSVERVYQHIGLVRANGRAEDFEYGDNGAEQVFWETTQNVCEIDGQMTVGHCPDEADCREWEWDTEVSE